MEKSDFRWPFFLGIIAAEITKAGFPELAPTSDESYQAYMADDAEYFATYRELSLVVATLEKPVKPPALLLCDTPFLMREKLDGCIGLPSELWRSHMQIPIERLHIPEPEWKEEERPVRIGHPKRDRKKRRKTYGKEKAR
jgi:hypothetical protein